MRSSEVAATPWSARSFQVKRLVVGGTLRERKARAGMLFVLPTMLFALVIFGFPTLFTVVLTFFDWSTVGGLGEFVGGTYYSQTLEDAAFWRTMRNTATLALFSVPITIFVAFVAALALQSSTRVMFRTGFRLIYFLPVVTSTLAMAFVWKWLYNPSYGLFNHLLGYVNVPPQLWLDSPRLVLPSLALVYIWARFGFDMLIFIAGLEGISTDYYDAAAIDGASKLQVVRHITVPLLNRQLVLVAVLETIAAVKVFDIPYAATQGGPGDASRTTVMYIYDTAFTLFEFGRASVAALVLFAFIVVVTLVQRRFIGRSIED